ncbi:MAG TPA: tripartite tricarboxylate transporter TctB family protein [Candidatus Binatia bacterium]|jgi:putative tricarboxylic transport membrane protein|nr:tripartite tricarboxylate transporter TctB family protein [Candidatus Binatia bacterium]
MRRDKGNLTAGIVLAGFGLYVISVAVRLPYVSDVGPGPGFFPLWLGIGLVLFASTLIFTSITSLRQGPTKETETWRLMARSLSGWLALMIAIALLGSIGFVASFIILTIFLTVALERRPALLALGVGVGLAVAFHLIFVVALDVSLPKAVWGF